MNSDKIHLPLSPWERGPGGEGNIVYLLGFPLTHSFSPAMHNAAFQTVRLDWRYEALSVEPERLAEAVGLLRREDCAGANVTVPHKETIIPFLDGLTPLASAIGAVNTIVRAKPDMLRTIVDHGSASPLLIGHNTDAAGLLADLYAHGVPVSRRCVLILGAGGSARAAVAACAGVGAKIRVIARRLEQAKSLRTILDTSISNDSESFAIFPWTPLGFLEASDACALVINTTPMGMASMNAGPGRDARADFTPAPLLPRRSRERSERDRPPASSPWPSDIPFPPDAFVYDLVYNPPVTPLIAQARAAGQQSANGLGMLVEQGALAFEMWTGLSAPREVMRSAGLQGK